MRRFIEVAAALILAFLILLPLASCEKNPESPGNSTDSLPESGAEQNSPETSGDATLEFRETDDGYVLSALRNPEGFNNLAVRVPETHNGKPVVGVDIDGSIDFIFPRMLSVEAFETLMDAFAETINRDSEKNGLQTVDWKETDPVAARASRWTLSQNVKWLDFNRFEAFYFKRSLSEAATEHEKRQLSDLYPQCRSYDFYALTSDVSYTNLAELSELLREYVPSYSLEDKLRDESAVDYYKWKDYKNRVAYISHVLFEDEIDRYWNEATPVERPVSRESITEFVIPDSITFITGCPIVSTRIADFNIPAGVIEIRVSFFCGCREDISVTYGGQTGWTASLSDVEYGKVYTLKDLFKPEVSVSTGNRMTYKLHPAPAGD